MSHIMLSYNWGKQGLVNKVHDRLTQTGIRCWMDIRGGIKFDLADSMAKGVENAVAIVCFCTKEYQNSRNCKKELQYAVGLDVLIIPVICDKNYTVQRQNSNDEQGSACGYKIAEA